MARVSLSSVFTFAQAGLEQRAGRGVSMSHDRTRCGAAGRRARRGESPARPSGRYAARGWPPPRPRARPRAPGAEREDVVDDDVGSRLAQRHARLGGGQDDGLVGLQRSLAGGEDRIRGAATNRMPWASTCSCQRDHVSKVTSCPRPARHAPSASIGNACPGSRPARRSPATGRPARRWSRPSG